MANSVNIVSTIQRDKVPTFVSQHDIPKGSCTLFPTKTPKTMEQLQHNKFEKISRENTKNLKNKQKNELTPFDKVALIIDKVQIFSKVSKNNGAIS